MEITVTSQPNCDLVAIKGRIDSYTAPSLADVLKNITEQNHFQIILDLGDVMYVSSAGLRVLIDIQKTCKKIHPGEVLLVNVPQRVYDTLELAGFVPLFRFFQDVDSALTAF
ncbi:MAG: anti-sigma factor antagonist [Anaerolineales bacterium]|nr:STAS domain-containing protein [Anaerolineae bacterium]PWB52977.1 MAG: anti-sigma factor antagonist [Anaerolineales bacterium]